MTKKQQYRNLLALKNSITQQWIGFSVAVLFGLYSGYIPFHLLTESHFHLYSSETTGVESDHESSDHDHDGHKPHDANEHLFQCLGRTAIPVLATASVDSNIPFLLPEPKSNFPCFSGSTEKPPDDAPRQTSQPRAPPLA